MLPALLALLALLALPALLALLAAACGTSGAVDTNAHDGTRPPCGNAAYPECEGECPIGYLCATDSDRPGLCLCIVDTETTPLSRESTRHKHDGLTKRDKAFESSKQSVGVPVSQPSDAWGGAR